MAKGGSSDAAGIISTGQAAKLLMVTEEWVNKLHKMEYLPKAGRGKWNLVSVVQGYINFLKDDERRSSKSASASRMQEVKTERLEQQMMAERRDLIPLADARLVLDTAAALIQSKMMSIPAQYTRDPVERARLEALVSAQLNTIADEIEAKAEDLRTGSLDG